MIRLPEHLRGAEVRQKINEFGVVTTEIHYFGRDSYWCQTGIPLGAVTQEVLQKDYDAMQQNCLYDLSTGNLIPLTAKESKT